MESSPGKGSSLDDCKQLCEDTVGCQSIAYFTTGWCSHFSTPCTNTKSNSKASAALRVSAGLDIISTAAPEVTVGQLVGLESGGGGSHGYTR